ncbi:hypothetical protein GILI108418_01720 [Gillisia limnaea]|uniref:Uncharacterized protein n=1 Tax=Gillisia limnaea (strain DSM 15749 / LMG 21470 / R-8282) TaxID=865937 RepID=H2BZ44_GILLR|nr:hypothetical protein Gilli_2776 [Gillisia limnaea DSM 15749]
MKFSPSNYADLTLQKIAVEKVSKDSRKKSNTLCKALREIEFIDINLHSLISKHESKYIRGKNLTEYHLKTLNNTKTHLKRWWIFLIVLSTIRLMPP